MKAGIIFGALMLVLAGQYAFDRREAKRLSARGEGIQMKAFGRVVASEQDLVGSRSDVGIRGGANLWVYRIPRTFGESAQRRCLVKMHVIAPLPEAVAEGRASLSGCPIHRSVSDDAQIWILIIVSASSMQITETHD